MPGGEEAKMAVNLVNHSWNRIFKRDLFAKQVLKEKIQEVEQLEESISHHRWTGSCSYRAE